MALLQEAPPLWCRELARLFGANGRSRGSPPGISSLPVQRFLANLNPDLIASWEGGSNQLLVRATGRRGSSTATMALASQARAPHDALDAGDACRSARRCASRTSTRRPGCPTQAGRGELLHGGRSGRSNGRLGDPLVFGGDLNVLPEADAGGLSRELRYGLRTSAIRPRPGAIDHLLRPRPPTSMEPPRRLPSRGSASCRRRTGAASGCRTTRRSSLASK